MVPGVAHLVFGLFIVIPIMFIAKDRFNYKVGVIFVINNLYGPDSFWAWRFIPIYAHTILGYLIWAIPLALFYSYLSRYSLHRSKYFLKLVDDGRREISWRHAYLLCVAGGILHFYIDTFYHLGTPEVTLFPNLSIPFDEFLLWGVSSIKISQGLIFIGFILMVSIAILTIYFLRKEIKEMLFFLFAIIGLVFLLFFTIGGDIFGNELEIIAIGYNFFYLFLPLIFLVYVANFVHNNPRKASESPLIDTELALKIIVITVILLMALFIYFGLDTIIGTHFINMMFGSSLSNEILIVIGSILIGAASLGLIGGIGLYFKNNFCRYLVILVSILQFLWIYPFTLTLFLCDKDIKKIFTSRAED
ncbi:MAG: hypothetical protein ACFFBP_07915 [Promethearchaeota archaeon]